MAPAMNSRKNLPAKVNAPRGQAPGQGQIVTHDHQERAEQGGEDDVDAAQGEPDQQRHAAHEAEKFHAVFRSYRCRNGQCRKRTSPSTVICPTMRFAAPATIIRRVSSLTDSP
jgi:hypothetical protein